MNGANQVEAENGNTRNPNEDTPLVVDAVVSGEKSESPGLSVNQTTLLLAAEMAGLGVLPLPRALVNTEKYIYNQPLNLKLKLYQGSLMEDGTSGWLGIPVMIVVCVMACFSGKRLGDCWSIVEQRNPQMRVRKRNPYAIIVNEAFGPKLSKFVSLCINVTLFGVGVVYLLVAAQIFEDTLHTLAPSITYCLWLLIVVISVGPLMYFGSPKDFTVIGIIALVSTLAACVLYFIQMLNDIKPYKVFRWGYHNFQDFFMSFGTFLFAFGGASTFPTIQNDMADRNKFNKSLQISMGAILLLYLVIAITGYAVYGESAAPNVAMSLTPTTIALLGNILMAVHLLSAFVIILNPVCQQLEEFYRVPRDSIGWRITVRIGILMGILFVGESIPRFHTIISLIGGTTVAMLTFVLPSWCYMKLNAEATEINVSYGWMKLVCWEVIVVGVTGGIAATCTAVNAILNQSQTLPCYIR